MKKRHTAIKGDGRANAASRERMSRTPIVALVFSFTPVLLLLLSYLNAIFGDFLLLSFWGVFFQIPGVTIGIFALREGRKKIGTIGLLLSIIAILLPFVWWWRVRSLHQQGTIELFL